ncbi:MAG: polysaccharide biosynthesis/export family protein [Bacteroidia bacterium]|nr:polysaccharide biosynthesis/export family protein [Bacteroidia bacterium]
MKILQRNKILQIIVLFVVCISAFSCRTINSNEMFKTDPEFKYSEFKPSEKEYKIQPFDKLDVKVFANDGFKLVDVSQTTAQLQTSMSYSVEYDGLVKLPTIGRVQIAGQTIREAEKLLENKYKEFFVDPFILISVTNKRIIVFSGGSAAGKVLPLNNENYTLIEAIAESGGITDFSKSHKIKLLRGDLNNPEVFLFSVRDLKDMKSANFLLQANDIIYVESRPKYASRVISEISPYIGLLTSALFIYGLFLK